MNTPFPQTLQTLPPKWAHFCLNIEAFLTARISSSLNNIGLLVACSGGLDSIALVHILAYLRDRSDFRIIVAHLDHGLRSQSSQDTDFVRQRAAQLGIAVKTKCMNVAEFAHAHGLGVEEAGRICRYDFFEQLRNEQGLDWIVLAHHADDLMEDVLLRLMRGTGWPALAGMAAVDDARHLVRPLLMVQKSRLRNFLKDINVDWREDKSNTDPKFTRNRVRNTLLPLMLKENPSLHESIARLWHQAEVDANFFADAIAQVPITQTEHGPQLDLEGLAKLHPAIRLRLYKQLLDQLGPGQALAENLFELDCAIERGLAPSPAIFQFPGNKTVRITGRKVLFCLASS